MNERIVWDLVSKAREHAVSDTPDGGKCFDQDVFHNKFAELIVRECMKEAWEEIIDDENIDAESDPLIREYLIGQNQGIVDAVIRFRNHFGVEE